MGCDSALWRGCSCDTGATPSKLWKEPRRGCSYTLERDKRGVASAPLRTHTLLLKGVKLQFPDSGGGLKKRSKIRQEKSRELRTHKLFEKAVDPGTTRRLSRGNSLHFTGLKQNAPTLLSRQPASCAGVNRTITRANSLCLCAFFLPHQTCGRGQRPPPYLSSVNVHPGAERTAVAAIWPRMRMRILTRPENSLANFSRQISNKKASN